METPGTLTTRIQQVRGRRETRLQVKIELVLSVHLGVCKPVWIGLICIIICYARHDLIDLVTWFHVLGLISQAATALDTATAQARGEELHRTRDAPTEDIGEHVCVYF